MNFIVDYLNKLATNREIRAKDKEWEWLKSLPKNISYTATRNNFAHGGPFNLAESVVKNSYPVNRVKMNAPRPKYYTKMSVPNYNDIINYATNKARSMGAHPSVVASQLATESNRGKSSAALNRNNYFGYQAYDSNPSASRSFSSPQESVDAYFNLMSEDPRYSRAWSVRNDPMSMLKEIKSAGYATDPNYVKTVSGTPEWRQYLK